MPLVTPLSPTTLSTDPHTYLHTELYSRRKDYLTPAQIRIKVGTWNVASLAVEREIREWIRDCEGESAPYSHRKRPSRTSRTIGELLDEARDRLQELGLSKDKDKGSIDLYVIALQEIVDVTAPENYLRPTDSKIPLNWKAHVQAMLPTGYKLIASPQLIGLLLLVYASPKVYPSISSISSSTVGTGLMGYVGNKGATGVRIVLGETTRLVIINCHLAAFQNGTDRRNYDHSEILRRMAFDKVKRDVLAGFPPDGNINAPMTNEKEPMDKADLIIWTGDLNYRIDLPNDDIRNALESFVPLEFPPSVPSEGPASPASFTSPKAFNFSKPSSEREESLDYTIRSLLAHDQLYKQQVQGKSFIGYKEGKITFLPTYKYDVGTLGVFDSSEKKRGPSYCDRVLWRMKDEDEPTAQDQEAKTNSENRSASSFETIRSGTAPHKDTSEVTPIPTPQLNVIRRPRATTLTVEDEDGEDLIVSPSDNILPHLPLPPEKEEESEDVAPESFPQNATVSSSSKSNLKLELLTYTSHQSVRASDHKPVTAIFNLTFPTVNNELKSEVYAEVAKEVDRIENERRPVVTVIIDREGEVSSPARSDYRDEDMNISLGEVHLCELVEKKITIANTGLVPAKCRFKKRPIIEEELGEEMEAISKPWLYVDFDSDHSNGGKAMVQGVELEPGEIVTVYLNVLIKMSDVSLLQKLNDGEQRLEDILVLHVENGRDIFLPVNGVWMQSCFGRSLQELVMIPEGVGGARAFFAAEKRRENIEGQMKEAKYSAPRELYRITENLLNRVKSIVEEDLEKEDGVEKQKWYADVGWPFVRETWGLQYDVDEDETGEDTADKRRKLLVRIQEYLSQDKEFEFEKWSMEDGYTMEDIVEVTAECLTGFLESLKGRVIPKGLYEMVMKGGAGGSKEAEKVLEALPTSASPIHANVFIYLTGFISEMLATLSPSSPIPPTPLTRTSTTDTVASSKSSTNPSNRSSMIKSTARHALLKQRLAGHFAEVMMYKPPPVTSEKGKTAGNRDSMLLGRTNTVIREKKGDEERRRAFLVHFLQF
ncbi:Endonuclease/exonuclease/phosphatase [Kalaharituber pfeilii]|nr:Endonuclease/exonuclease/phosphatase [Kalaharituber pfeilii]